MSENPWNSLYDEAVETFGSSPNAALEQRLIEAYQQRPKQVEQALKRAQKRFESGEIHSPWGVLTKALVDLERRPDQAVSGAAERVQAEVKAEQWLRATGVHFDRASEVEDELFGDRESEVKDKAFRDRWPLRFWAKDEALRERMLALWEGLRARGERVEREAETRQRRAGENWRQTVQMKRRPPLREPEPEAPDPRDREEVYVGLGDIDASDENPFL